MNKLNLCVIDMIHSCVQLDLDRISTRVRNRPPVTQMELEDVQHLVEKGLIRRLRISLPRGVFILMLKNNFTLINISYAKYMTKSFFICRGNDK